MRVLLPLVLLFAVLAPPALARQEAQGQIQEFRYKTALQTSQDAIGQRLGDYMLTDDGGRAVSLANFRGKPLVISMVYTSCYEICPMTTRHLAKVVDKARDVLGQDAFEVLLIGFDAQYDTPQAMRHFARKQGVLDRPGWHLLSGDPDTIAALARDLGFVFFPSPNGFDHLIQATVVDADGLVYQQVYGETFDTQLLVEPLLDLVLGRPRPEQGLLDDIVNRVRLFCTTYDPNTDAYHFDYSLFIGMIIGGGIILLTILFLVREVRRNRRPPAA